MYHDSVCIAENIVVLLLFQKRRSSCLPFPMAFLRARARASTHPHTHAQIPTHSRTYTPPHKYRALFGYLHDVLLLTLDLATTTELCTPTHRHTQAHTYDIHINPPIHIHKHAHAHLPGRCLGTCTMCSSSPSTSSPPPSCARTSPCTPPSWSCSLTFAEVCLHVRACVCGCRARAGAGAVRVLRFVYTRMKSTSLHVSLRPSIHLLNPRTHNANARVQIKQGPLLCSSTLTPTKSPRTC